MKNFVKAMDKIDQAFKYFTSKFPRLSDANYDKGGVFIGPQIRQLLRQSEFDSALCDNENAVLEVFKLVGTRFIVNKKADNYKELIENLIKAYKCINVTCYSRSIFLFPSTFFPSNCGAVSDEHDKRFHPDISCMEKLYQGKWSPEMLEDYFQTVT